MESITGESRNLRLSRCVALVGVVAAALLACTTPGTPTESYELVLNAPGLETVQPQVVVTHDGDYSQVERSTWKARQATWPQADLVFWRIKDTFRNKQVYVYEDSLPEFIEVFLPSETITLGDGGSTKNVLGKLAFQRFSRGQFAECIFIEQGISRFSDQLGVIGSGDPLGDMVIRGWYCVGPSEPNQEAAFQGFIAGINIAGWSLPARGITDSSPFPYAVKFTSEVYRTSSGEEVTDNIKRVTLDSGRVYVYVKWRGLTKGRHVAQVRVFDGGENRVESSSYDFTSTSSEWSTWWPYDFDPGVDQPGNWRFEIDVDGETLVNKTLIVSPSLRHLTRSGTTGASRDAAFRVYQKFDEAFEYKVFVRNHEGAWAWLVRNHYYSAQSGAIKACQERSRESGQSGVCRLYAVGDDIVWDLPEKEREDIIMAYSE